MRVAVGELGLKQIYKHYCQKVKDPLSYEVFKEVCIAHNKKAFGHYIIEKGENFRVPYRLGFHRVRKRKMDFKHLSFDYGEFNKTGKKSFHLNEHSDEFKGRIIWEKKKCIVKGKRPYSFQATREYKRKLASILKTPGGHKRYLET